MNGYRLLLPILVLSASAFLALGIDATADSRVGRRSKISLWCAIVGFLAAAALIPMPPLTAVPFGRGALVWDSVGYVISWLAIVTGLFVVVLGMAYEPFAKIRLSAYFGLLSLASVGIIFMAMSNDLLMLFLSIELVSLPSFILVGYFSHQRKSSGAALKFFLIGAFSSAMLAYGISLFYGLTGTTSIATLPLADLIAARPAFTLLACMFVLVGFGFKMALVPFHVWLPDAFEGAPTPIAAFLSIAPKIAAALAAMRVFGAAFHPSSHAVMMTLAILAALTMTAANLFALRQRNILRLFAYSSIAHMGYVLLGIVAASPAGTSAVFVYAWVYLFMNLGAFAVITLVVGTSPGGDFSALAGLAKRSPFLAAMLALFLCALAGVPPTAGFLAKFYIFSALYQAGWIKLVFIAVINTVISMAYYFRVVRVLYFEPASGESRIPVGAASLLTLGVASFFTLLLGVAPQLLLAEANDLVPSVAAAAAPSGDAKTALPPERGARVERGGPPSTEPADSETESEREAPSDD